MAKEEPAVALTQEQFTQLLAAIKQSGNAEQTSNLETILLKTAEVSAQNMKRALKPENEQHHGKSIYAYPEGDLAKPRPELGFEFYWNGFPVHKFRDIHHWYELELMAQLQPGEYRVSLANNEGTQKVSVKADRDANGKIERMDVKAEGMSRDVARSAPPTAVWLYQMLHADQPLGVTYIEGTKRFMEHVVMSKPPVLA